MLPDRLSQEVLGRLGLEIRDVWMLEDRCEVNDCVDGQISLLENTGVRIYISPRHPQTYIAL